MVMNEGVNIHCKEVTTQVFPNLLVELVADITKSKGSIYASPFLRQTLVTVTSNCPVIYSSILSSLFLSSMLRTNSIIRKSRG